MLQIYEGFPERLLDLEAARLKAELAGPSLIEVPGRREPPLFVSVLLHGNETTGWEAVQRVLSAYRSKTLPRSLLLLIGNVDAAAARVRRLPGQPDFNRIWPGTSLEDGPEQRMAAEVVARVRSRGCFASIDIHNNTGVNPHYGCVNRLEGPYLQLAALFSRTVVYFTRPHGVQSLAMANIAPAITVECGQPGSPGAAEHAAELLASALQLSRLPQGVPAGVSIYHTVAAVRIPRSVSFSFGAGEAVEMQLMDDLERCNFRELPAGTRFARVRPGSGAFFSVEDNEGREAAAEYFLREGDEIQLRQPATPAMLACNEEAIRQDVLCYLMERIAPPEQAAAS